MSWLRPVLNSILGHRSKAVRRAPRRALQLNELGPRIVPAVTAVFIPGQGILSVHGDGAANTIAVSRDAAGNLLVNGGAVPIRGGTATVANVAHINVFGLGGNDTITLDEANGALPAANLFGGAGNDTVTGGSGGDYLFGQSGNDVLLGKGGADFLFGGVGDDTLTGGDGDDQAFGQSGNDRMIWNPGDDTDLNEGGLGIDTVEVNGGNGSEEFTVTANGARIRFDRVNPAPFSIDIGTSENLQVNMNGGDDKFSATGNLSTLIQIAVDGGAGNDTILGGNGNDRLVGGDGNDFIDGNQGADEAFLGAGDDVFQWDPGDGSDLVEGGDGADRMIFNGAAIDEKFEASANGRRVRFTRNIGNIVMDLDDVEQIDLNTLGGVDSTTVNDMTGTDLIQLNVNQSATIDGTTGDGAQDSVIVNGTNGNDSIEVFGTGTSFRVSGLQTLVAVTNSEGANDTLEIRAQGGDDNVNASSLQATVVKQLTEDGGLGNDSLFGSRGDDRMLGGDGDDFLLGFRGNDFAQMGAGNDEFEWDPGDGSDTIEGQAGIDTMLFNGANISEHIEISANGGRVRFTRDIGSITMDTDDLEVIDFTAFGDPDTIIVNDLTGTDVTEVNLDLSGAANPGSGDGASDSVTIFGTNDNDGVLVTGNASGTSVIGLSAQVNITGAEAARDRLTIESLAGDDAVNASGLSADAIALTVDGGADDDILTGGAGDDNLLGGDGDDVLIGGPGNDSLDGGSGDNDLFQ